jgi:putative transposase
LDLSRSTFYYQALPEDPEDEVLRTLLDEEFTARPFFETRKLRIRLKKRGYQVNRKRVRRLMRELGLSVIYRKPRLSIPGRRHKIYPYLLRGLAIVRPNRVWSNDITYVRLAHGFVYLMAIIDVFSRTVISWALSTTLEKDFCLEALRAALGQGKPEIFNTDQGSQFTSPEFTGLLERQGIRVSMDGRGRVFDNIFVERLWRSVKYEEVYLHEYRTVSEARQRLADYFHFYNTGRPHEALGYRTPHEVQFGTQATLMPASEAIA